MQVQHKGCRKEAAVARKAPGTGSPRTAGGAPPAKAIRSMRGKGGEASKGKEELGG